MSTIDVDGLLAEVSADLPCGENLEYDAAYGELERSAQGKPEQVMGDTIVRAEEPNWDDVRKKAVELFARTKDLRICMYLVQALIHKESLIGLNDGLKLLKGLLEQYWDSVHPQLDPDDDNDPTLRVNTLAGLCDQGSFLRSLREAPLVSSKVLGRHSLRDIMVATGEITGSGDPDEPPPELSTIEAAFMDCDLEELQAMAQAGRDSIDQVVAIEDYVTDQVGATNAADLSDLTHLLKEIGRVLSERLAKRGVGDGTANGGEAGDDETAAPAAAAGAGGQAAVKPIAGEITSTQDVIRMIDKICDYYHKHEPSSPVPMLLRRAKRLVSKDFMEILRDLAPDGVSQAENIRGADTDESSE